MHSFSLKVVEMESDDDTSRIFGDDFLKDVNAETEGATSDDFIFKNDESRVSNSNLHDYQHYNDKVAVNNSEKIISFCNGTSKHGSSSDTSDKMYSTNCEIRESTGCDYGNRSIDYITRNPEQKIVEDVVDELIVPTDVLTKKETDKICMNGNNCSAESTVSSLPPDSVTDNEGSNTVDIGVIETLVSNTEAEDNIFVSYHNDSCVSESVSVVNINSSVEEISTNDQTRETLILSGEVEEIVAKNTDLNYASQDSVGVYERLNADEPIGDNAALKKSEDERNSIINDQSPIEESSAVGENDGEPSLFPAQCSIAQQLADNCLKISATRNEEEIIEDGESTESSLKNDVNFSSQELFPEGSPESIEKPPEEILSSTDKKDENFVETESVISNSNIVDKNYSQIISGSRDESIDDSVSEETVSVNVSLSDFSDDINGSNDIPNNQSPLKSAESSQPILEWQPQINSVSSTCDNLSITLNRLDDKMVQNEEVKEEIIDEAYEVDSVTKEKFKLVNFSIKLEKIDTSILDGSESTPACQRKTRQQSNMTQECNFHFRTRSKSEKLRDRFRKPLVSIARTKLSDRRRVRMPVPVPGPARNEDENRRSLRSSGSGTNDPDEARITFLQSLNLRSRKKDDDENIKSILVTPKASKITPKKVSFHLPDDTVLKERNTASTTRNEVSSNPRRTKRSVKRRKKILSRSSEKASSVPPRKKTRLSRSLDEVELDSASKENKVGSSKKKMVENFSESKFKKGEENPYKRLEKLVDKYKKTVEAWFECTCCNQRYHLLENVRVHVRSHFPNCLTN